MLENIIIIGVKFAKNDLQIKYGIETDSGVQPYATSFDTKKMNQERYKAISFAMQRMNYYLLNCSGVLPSAVLETYLVENYETYLDEQFFFKHEVPRHVKPSFDIADYATELQNCLVLELATDDGYNFIKLKGEYRAFQKPAKIETPKIATPGAELNNSVCIYPYNPALWSDYESLAVQCRQLIRNDTERVAAQLDMFSSVERAAMNRLEDALQTTKMGEA